VKSVIEWVVEQKDEIDRKKMLIIPNVNLTPIEVEKIKENLESFGFNVFALPDLSDSLDGHLGVKQGALSGGGITLEEIANLGNSALVITIGESVKKCGEVFQARFPKTHIVHVNSLQGLKASDEFYGKIIEYKGDNSVPPQIKRWRSRLQDTLLDAHFVLSKTKVIVADEPDSAYSISRTLMEAGCKMKAFISQKSDILGRFKCKAEIGDFEDLENAR
jgi:nitrogenase molybdenum-iron protein NifN